MTVEANRRFRKAHPERAKAISKRYYGPSKGQAASRKAGRKRNGCEDVSEEQCIALLRKQKGCCGICKKPLVWPDRNTCVDHDHKTGKVRGILCTKCNLKLDWVQDNEDAILGYLHKEVRDAGGN